MFVGLGMLLVIALFTALIAPYFIDWTAYKRDFEEQATKIVGQKVTVGGNANVRILPLPSLSFSNLSVGQNADGSAMMTVKRFSANVELMPFLSGEVRIVDMALENPHFNLVVDETGKIAWTNRQGLKVDPGQIKLDKLSVSNASMVLTGLASGPPLTASGINADISAQSLYGPWKISGSGIVESQDTGFEISTGVMSDAGTVRLKANLQSRDEPYRLTLDGPVSLRDDILFWDGKFQLDPETANATSGLRTNRREPLPAHVTGDFVLQPTRLDLPEYRIEIGPREDPFTLSGDGYANLKGEVEFYSRIDGRQIDLDRVAKMLEGEEASATTLEERVALVRGVLDQIPVPQYKGAFDLEIPAIVAGDTLIREISAIVRPLGTGWEISRLSAQLPGNTKIETSGRLGIGEDFGFHGKLLVASRQPSGFSAWISGKVDPAMRALGTAGLEADVTFTTSQTSFENMELVLGENRLSGRMQRLGAIRSADGKVSAPAIVAEIAGETVRLEDLKAVASLATGEDSGTNSSDFDVSLKAGELTGLDLNAREVDLNFQLTGGELSIVRLNAEEFLGASIKSRGQIANVLSRPKGNFSVELKAGNAVQLVQEIQRRWGPYPALSALEIDEELTADTRLVAEIDASPAEDGSRSRIIIGGQTGGTEFSVRGGLIGRLSEIDTLAVDLSLDANSDDPNVFIRQIGGEELGFDPLMGGVEGPLRLTLESMGNGIAGYSTMLSANIPDASIAARGIARNGEEGMELEFDTTLGTGDVTPLVFAFGYQIPGLNPLLDGASPFSMEGKITSNRDGGFALDINNSQLSGNTATGKIEYAIGINGRPMVSGDLQIDALTIPLLPALVFGISDPFGNEGTIASAWSEDEFTGPAFPGVDGRLVILAGALNTGTNEPGSNGAVTLEMSDGNITVSDFSMDWIGGKLSATGSIKSNEGTGLLQMQLAIAQADAGRLAEVMGVSDVIDGKTDISVSIEGSGKSAKAVVASLSGGGILTTIGSSITGIREEGLEAIIEASDADGFVIETASISLLAQRHFLQGSIEVPDVAIPFSVGKARLQFRNVPLGPETNDPVANAEFDLITGTTNADIRIMPDPGLNKVSGATPELKFLFVGLPGAMDVEIDTKTMEGFLAIRAFEREQRRVELLQAAILEKQRIRFQLLQSVEQEKFLEAQRQAEIRRLEEEQQALIEERRIREEEEKKAAEATRIEAERLAAEEQARLEAERKAAEEAARLEVERKAEEESARLESERKAAEEAAKNANTLENDNSGTGAIEIRPLDQPLIIVPNVENETPKDTTVRKNLFQDIEKLLFE